jgi:hypothetical protein
LIDWDYEKGDFIGMLAVGKPVISPYGNGLKLDYEIRPEATWTTAALSQRMMFFLI